jgi:HD-like signal output (HDOD) protein
VSAHEIAQQIAADPALTAKVLRLANSAFFHASRTIGTVDDALRMLGFIMVRNLVLGNGMVAAFKSSRGMDLQQFWRHTLYTAVAARWLAMHAGINGEDNGDAVFTVGMMHGIGQLQLHAVAPAGRPRWTSNAMCSTPAAPNRKRRPGASTTPMYRPNWRRSGTSRMRW